MTNKTDDEILIEWEKAIREENESDSLTKDLCGHQPTHNKNGLCIHVEQIAIENQAAIRLWKTAHTEGTARNVCRLMNAAEQRGFEKGYKKGKEERI